ncbi:hypothetical protein BN1708_008300 [Verticillium longisporum]|uniref:Uncharacterized protein n=1 Tax=Verticillium longisporum TaxID=100787 RepID=A0A0G4N2L2_VERLO|nr:hypothetical protein BN1708_008300 [Verticillium longisporum]
MHDPPLHTKEALVVGSDKSVLPRHKQVGDVNGPAIRSILIIRGMMTSSRYRNPVGSVPMIERTNVVGHVIGEDTDDVTAGIEQIVSDKPGRLGKVGQGLSLRVEGLNSGKGALNFHEVGHLSTGHNRSISAVEDELA